MMPQYVALARVSSREQEREGFSLDVQETALKAFAEKHGGTILRLFRIAETASKSEERKTFRELIAYSKKHRAELDGLLVYKVDRAARNLFDFVEIERLESEIRRPVPLRLATDREQSRRADDAADAGQHGQLLHRAAVRRRAGRPGATGP